MRTRLNVAGAFLVGVCATGCGGGPNDAAGLRPDSSEFTSEWVDVSMGGMMAVPGEGPALTLNLKNTSRKPIWVEVEFTTPEGSQNCTVSKKLAVSGGGMFMCSQQSIVQDRDYPVLVRTYADAQKSTLLESTQTKFRFGSSDVARFNELRESMREAKKD